MKTNGMHPDFDRKNYEKEGNFAFLFYYSSKKLNFHSFFHIFMKTFFKDRKMTKNSEKLMTLIDTKPLFFIKNPYILII